MTTDPRITRSVVTEEELRADVERVLAEEHTTWDEFVRDGRTEGGHDSFRLRDVWLLAGRDLADR